VARQTRKLDYSLDATPLTAHRKGELIMNFIQKIFWRLGCDIHNNIVEPISRRHDRKKKTHYECCVCGTLEAPYFYDECEYSSMRWDYGWHKIDGGKRWVCHHCSDHGYSPITAFECSFEDWHNNYVVPQRAHVKALIKTKDPEYYDECYFYDEEND
jgi:hypothetical protein